YYEVGREIKSISPKIICGIEYGDGYNDRKDINWLELFISLKRLNRVVRNFRTYEEIIKHIHYPHKDEKQVSQFGNHYFTSSGQHRLCLAKLLDVESVEVKIIKYKLDEERLNANKRMLS